MKSFNDNQKFTIFQSELKEIESRRKAREIEVDWEDKEGELKPDLSHNLIGLSLSGGGIRSATFNLGFMQALFRRKILQRVDYLSTVSGGGYIGSCLTTLLNSETKKDIWSEENFPFERDAGKVTGRPGVEKEPVRWLRYFSNYLSAEGDFIDKYLRPVMIFLRGVVFNFFLIVPYLVIAGLLLALLYNTVWFFDLPAFEQKLKEREQIRRQLREHVLTTTASLPLSGFDERLEIAQALIRSRGETQRLMNDLNRTETVIEKDIRNIWVIPLILLSLLIGIAFLFSRWIATKSEGRSGLNRLLSLLLFLAGVVLALKLYALALAYWGIFSGIGFLSIVSYLGTKVFSGIKRSGNQEATPWGKLTLTILLIAFVPVVLLFIVGFIIRYSVYNAPTFPIANSTLGYYLLGLGATVVFWALTKMFINLNQISWHNFYRDRLSRAYLIENNPNSSYLFEIVQNRDNLKLSKLKTANAPYHILNTTLNLSKAMPAKDEKIKPLDGEFAFRAGESFVLTKNWCGSEKTGYINTADYETLDDHLNVGTAMAASGAAANIGMGQKNMSALRLLLGLFNIRLGYWAPNPGLKDSQKKKPLFNFPGAREAIREWLGIYSMNDRYVNISDGGHFDNIGVYELLRRKCKYVIVGDAEADPGMKFEALSYIIRLARIDFGIEIDIDVSDIKPDKNGPCRNHCAVGTIHYPDSQEVGYLLYCKSSLTGDEPEHLNEYKVKHPDFPHQTTADQWFDEQQFEAYRELGYHIGKNVFEPVKNIPVDNPERLFIGLKEIWYPHSEVVEKYFTRHTGELSSIITQIKNDEQLRFLDGQIYPEWEELMKGVKPPVTSTPWLPATGEEIRRGFYICNLMIQLMENVYTDLDLESQHSHPDNRGWMNLFRHWAWSGMFRITWTISASTYGARFQGFCEQQLGLELGSLEVVRASADELNPYEKQMVTEKFMRSGSPVYHTLYQFQLKVSADLDKNKTMSFPVGFALSDKKKQIIYFRIQNHLRNMGLGTRALRILVKQHKLKEFSEPKKAGVLDEPSNLESFKRRLHSVLNEQ